jgi:2-dehydropantoate 2-reductase
MQVAIMGSGGVGGCLGAMLARDGHDVTFIARGAHLQMIQAQGLRIERAHGENLFISPARATDDPAEIGPVDLVILGVKMYDLAAVFDRMRPLVGPQTTILTTQNGVEAPDLVGEAFGLQSVMPGIVYCEVAIKEPGVIYQGSPVVRLVLGEWDGAQSARARAIAEAFSASGVDTTLSANILSALWGKFCFICAMGGVTALMRQPLGPILADAEGRVLLRTVMEEVVAVAEAKGIRFETDPVTNGIAAAERFNYDTKSSMLRDLERGNRLEVETLNGAAVRLGRAVGVATPANQAIYAALRLSERVKG